MCHGCLLHLSSHHLGLKSLMHKLFLLMLSLSLPCNPQQALVCDVPLPVSMYSQCSTPTYEWEHAVFGFLLLYYFAKNDGFQLHSCACKEHELILFYGCIKFHGVYVPHFSNPVYYQLAFGLISGLCYCKQCCNEHSCTCVLIVERLIAFWIYTQ